MLPLVPGQMVEMLLQARADVGQRRNDPEVADDAWWLGWPEGRYDPWMPQNHGEHIGDLRSQNTNETRDWIRGGSADQLIKEVMICDTALVYGFEPLFSPHASMGKDGKRLETRTASRYGQGHTPLHDGVRRGDPGPLCFYVVYLIQTYSNHPINMDSWFWMTRNMGVFRYVFCVQRFWVLLRSQGPEK